MSKQYKGLVYEIIDKDNCFVKDFKSAVPKEELVVPEQIEGVPVTKLCLNTFIDTGNHCGATKQSIAKCAIKKVLLPNTIKEIVPESFYYQCNVESINIPMNLTTPLLLNKPCIQNFYVSENNNQYCTIDGVLFSKDKKKIIAYPKGSKRKDYEIPNGTEVVAECAFDTRDESGRELNNLKKIIIPSSVNQLESYAFYWCNAKLVLTNNHIESLGKRVFTFFENTIKPPLCLEYVKNYQGGAIHIGDDLEKVSFSKSCEIEYSPDIDYREYLYFNIIKILKNRSKKNKAVKYAFSYDKTWFSSKYSKHFFETHITVKDAGVLKGILNSSAFSQINNVTVENNIIVYRFKSNPTKMHYGQRTYKIYLDGFSKIIEIIEQVSK